MAEGGDQDSSDQDSSDQLAERFRRFATVECVPDSPLYSTLSAGIAEDPALLSLAALAPPDQPPANLLLAAVQDLLLTGIGHPLGRWFPSVDRAAPSASDPLPMLRDFCAQHHDALADRIRKRRVQTNECGRIALFLPALIGINSRMGEPLATIELGASAGLNLLWPWAAVDYGGAGRVDPLSPALSLKCEISGGRPPLSRRPPPAGLRMGLDSHPVDLHDPDAVRWLDALVWPEGHDRRHRLRLACEQARQRMVTVEKGDLRTDLGALFGRVGDGDHLVLLHSVVLYQLSVTERAALERVLLDLSHKTPFHLVGLEWIGTPSMELTCSFLSRGCLKTETLARVHPHGKWMEWLDAPIPL